MKRLVVAASFLGFEFQLKGDPLAGHLYPRSPCGKRLKIYQDDENGIQFQSTLPVWEATAPTFSPYGARVCKRFSANLFFRGGKMEMNVLKSRESLAWREVRTSQGFHVSLGFALLPYLYCRSGQERNATLIWRNAAVESLKIVAAWSSS